MQTLAEQLIEERNGSGCGAPVEPVTLVKSIRAYNLQGNKFLAYYQSLSKQEQLWLKNNGIFCQEVFDRNETFYHITWK